MCAYPHTVEKVVNKIYWLSKATGMEININEIKDLVEDREKYEYYFFTSLSKFKKWILSQKEPKDIIGIAYGNPIFLKKVKEILNSSKEYNIELLLVEGRPNYIEILAMPV